MEPSNDNDWLEAENQREFIIELRAATNEELVEKFHLYRKVASTPSVNDLVHLGNNQYTSVTKEDQATGSFFRILQLIRDEMNRRGMEMPGVKR